MLTSYADLAKPLYEVNNDDNVQGATVHVHFG